MERIVRSALLVALIVVVSGCGSPAAPTGNAAGLTADQEASAKVIGVATPNGVKQDAGPYTGDVNFAKSIVQTQQTREAREAAAVGAMSNRGR